ncbi:hypothetical protein CHLRE_03g155350v5 [Chlamydomonas reinhardtii]|uniref:FAD-binding FR-type domain-containing protein n=1 Tax=Chlamydomonas reinhardtii TaxID=3055 RepID=A0A2K3DVZ4_CHLRE|nr:uncharacterized protein CHLRE_03g155350v5 [Chlamydomonas reinhardtii]PNW84703.1 hypothetical protein CHLRE_03g155350v5 [Chlamydomonas reinhardtii]
MPRQHAEFYEQQSLFYVGGRDATGQPWASVLVGRPGFVSAPDSSNLILQSYRRLPEDPLLLAPGAHLGGLGIDLVTRRRNRVNGTVLAEPAASVSAAPPAPAAAPVVRVAVDLSFGNCPKYIQVRDVRLRQDQLPPLPSAAPSPAAAQHTASAPTAATAGVVVRGRGKELGAAQLALIAAADTFFIATSYSGGGNRGGARELQNAVGCDISHRGGPPGFLRLERDPRGGPNPVLRWADYAGNNMFQTLGNLATDARAGLLIVDWATGDTLQLAGTAETDFQDRSLPGAQRSVRFTVTHFIHAAGALPIDTSAAAAAAKPVQFSPYLPKDAPPPLAPGQVWTPRTAGAAHDGAAAVAAAIAAGAVAPAPAEQVEVVSVRWAAEGIKTFEFAMPKGQPTSYVAGQYAVFEFPACYERPAAEGPPASASVADTAASCCCGGTITRTWTLTSHPAADSAARGTFSITVKRAGAVSGRMHDALRPGDRLALRAFAGDFTTELVLPPAPAAAAAAGLGAAPAPDHLVLLLAGGIGVTPIWAVVNDLAQRAAAAAAAARGKGAGGSSGSSSGARQRVVVLYSVRRGEEAAFRSELRQLAEAAAEAAAAGGADDGGLDVQVLLTTTAAVPGMDPGRAAAAAAEAAAVLAARRGGYVEAAGVRLGSALVRAALGPAGLEALRAGRCAAMVCGPGGFMAAVERTLVDELGLPADRLHSESFAY